MSIETERLLLRPVALADAPAMVRLLGGDEAGVRMTERLPWPMAETAAREWLALRLRPGEHAFAVHPKDYAAIVGMVGFRREGDLAGFGYWIGAAFRGRGYATEALCAALGHARSLGARRAVAEIFLDNAASQRVLEKAGFVPGAICDREVPTRRGLQRLRQFSLSL
jgi:ribosomal-protein-alanine N-acetyltransferase